MPSGTAGADIDTFDCLESSARRASSPQPTPGNWQAMPILPSSQAPASLSIPGIGNSCRRVNA
jgi:hypothetical protein